MKAWISKSIKCSTLLTSRPGWYYGKILFPFVAVFFYTYVHKSVQFHAGCTSSTGVGGYLDGEGALGSVGLQVDLHGSRFTSCCDQFVTQFFQSVTTIRDELPDEHLVGWGAGREDRLQLMNLNVSLIPQNLLTSFSEYRDRATMSSNFFVSAWNSCLEELPG